MSLRLARRDFSFFYFSLFDPPENISEQRILSTRGRARVKKTETNSRKDRGNKIFSAQQRLGGGSLFYFHLATTRRTTKLLKW